MALVEKFSSTVDCGPSQAKQTVELYKSHASKAIMHFSFCLSAERFGGGVCRVRVYAIVRLRFL
jgi:hypothetical protein